VSQPDDDRSSGSKLAVMYKVVSKVCVLVVTDNIDRYHDMDCFASMLCYSVYMIPHAMTVVNIFRPRNMKLLFQQQLQV